MRNGIRNSGIDIIGDVPWGTHFCQFYMTKNDLMETLIRYLKTGMENNELCIWIIPELLSVEEAKEALKTDIPYIDIYLGKGQIELIPCYYWYMEDGAFDPEKVLNAWAEKLDQALKDGYKGLRATEDTCWLEKKSCNDLFDYEEKLDSLTSKSQMISLCTYTLDTCNAADIIKIAANHQFSLIKREGKWEQIDNYRQKTITECKQAEEALHKNEERYRMLFTNMTDGFGLLEVIYNTDDKPYDYRYLELNPAFELSLGVKREQMLGRTMLEVFPNVSLIALEKYREVALSGRSTHFEIFSQITHKYLDIYAFTPEKGKLALILRDITERKQMEKELQESEKKYRNIIETASEGIWMGNSEARTIYVNKKIVEMLGYTQDEMIGKYIWDFADEKGKPIVKKKIEKRRQGIDERYEFKFIRKDGSPVWTIVSSKSLFDDYGKFTGSMSMFTDITRRIEAEAKLKETLDNLEEKVRERTAELEKAYNSLKESERGLAEAQKIAHIGSWEWDIAADKADWSDELYRIFGRDPQESVVTYEEFLSYVHPDDRDYVDSEVKQALNGKPFNIDFRIISADGTVRIVNEQGEVTFDEKNNPVRMRGTVQDITERKLAQQKLEESEERYRSFIENFKGIAFQADENFIPVFLHGTVEEITGYSEEEFMSRQPWKEIIHPEDLPSIYEEEEKVRNSPHKASGEVDFRIIRRDGKVKWVHEIYQKIPGNNRTPDMYQGAIYDITERIEAEETLAKIEKIRIKEIHHRIKNNLQVISSLLDLQADAFSHLEVCKTPDVVEAFMESQNRVISMALIHEELYKGDKVDTLDFAAYLRKLTEDLFSSYSPGNMDINFKLDLEQVDLGMDTAIPLGIVVNELVSNSFKHAFPAGEEGEIQINLRRIETSASGDDIFGPDEYCIKKKGFHYVLEVSDNGKGIPEEIDIKNLDSLGLQLVNILVEQIDGCIEFERSQGIKFIIWFRNLEA